MAGELASAIAKTGQPRNRPQSVGVSEAALDNAFNGRRRADEAKAAKEAADRDKRLGEISKNTIFSKQFENDIYNRQFQKISSEALDNIYKSYQEGGNITVDGMREVQKLKDIGSRLHAADKNLSMTEAQFNKDPSSVAWYTQGGEVGGNKYQNVFQALKDPRTDGRIQELNDNFSNPAIMFQEDDINGSKIYTANLNLGAAATANGMTEADKMISAEDYNLALAPTRIKLGNTEMDRYSMGLQPETIGKVVTAVGANPATTGYAVKNKFFEDRAAALANGKNLTYEEWANTADIPNISVQYMDNLAGALKNKTGNNFQITDRPVAAKEPKPSAVEKNYGGWGEVTFNKNTRERSASLGQAGTQPRETDIIIPLGSKTHDEKGMMIDSPQAGGTGSKSAIAKGPAVLKDGKLYLKYLADNGDGGYEDVFVPATNENFKEFAQNTRAIESQDAMDELLKVTGDVVGVSGKKVLDGFVDYLSKGGVNAKFPSDKPSAKTAESGNITVELNGQTGSIPAANWEAFKKKNPNAIKK